MVYNKHGTPHNVVFATNAEAVTCDDCSIIVTWKSVMHYLAGVNRIAELIRENKLDQNCGTKTITQIISHY